jgi:hypothetical protein
VKARAKASRLRELGCIMWAYKGSSYISPIVATCPKCGKRAVIRLRGAALAEQTDGTTHVCHPSVGGCNHGFALEA